MPPKKIRLTRKRLKWAAPRKATLKGERLPPYSAAVSAKYGAALAKIIKPMQAEYMREVKRLLRDHASEEHALSMDGNLGSQARILFGWLGKKYAKIFGERASAMTEKMINGASIQSKHALGESLKKISGGITLQVPDMPAGMAERVAAATAENVGLIKSIQQQYHERISQLVLRSAANGGNGAQDLFEAIRKYDGMTERRAELIAIDQTRKITTVMNVERAKSVGMRKFEWIHSGGSAEPRKLHLELDGKIFDYSDPPIIGSNGERGFPGQMINCRCTLAPVLELGNDDDARDSQ